MARILATIKLLPGLSREAIIEDMVREGFPKKKVIATLNQLVKQRILIPRRSGIYTKFVIQKICIPDEV